MKLLLFLLLSLPVAVCAQDGLPSSRYIYVQGYAEVQDAIDAAHKNPNVLAMGQKFFALCDCVPLKTLAEAEEMFAGFEPVD